MGSHYNNLSHFNCILIHSISYLGWGDGSGSNHLYQVHLELLNQSVCNDLLNSNNGTNFNSHPYDMCRRCGQDGARTLCNVGHHYCQRETGYGIGHIQCEFARQCRI